VPAVGIPNDMEEEGLMRMLPLIVAEGAMLLPERLVAIGGTDWTGRSVDDELVELASCFVKF
jgi:hypothetical protein